MEARRAHNPKVRGSNPLPATNIFICDMALGKVNHLDFFVDDLEKTLEYFTEKMGFKLIRRTEHLGKAIELASPAGDLIFEFHQMTEEYQSNEAPVRPYFSHVAFEVDDLDKTYEELKNKGVPFITELDVPHLRAETGRKVANTYDADGHRWIQLQEVKPE